jgi:serine/threonine-protein kinase
MGSLLPWGIAAALAGVLFVQGLGFSGSGGTAPFPTTRTSLALGELALPASERIEVSPAGDRFVMAAVAAGEVALYVRNADEEEFRKIPGTEGARDPSFSPDGEWVVFGSEAGIMKVALAGGAPRPLVPGQRSGNPSNAWAEDGTILFRDRQGLRRVSENGGDPEIVRPWGWAFNARPLPGERGVIVTNRNTGTTMFVDLQRDTAWVVVPDGVDARYLKSGHLLYVDPSGGLWSVPFDESEGRATGGAVPLLGGIAVVQGFHARYAVSETGTLVYTTGGSSGGSFQGRFKLASIELDGSVQADPLSPRNFTDAVWAPDGERLAYIDDSGGTADGPGATNQLYVYNAALGTTPNPMTFSGINFRPVWSPDGSRVVFASAREGSDGFDLYVKEVDTDAPPRNLRPLPGAEFPTDWLEGDTILFELAATQADGDDLWMAVLVDEDSVAVSRYLSSEADLNSLVVRPGGGWAAYSSDESGVERVYVRAFPEPRQQVAISDAGQPGNSPVWSPDGNVLYYWSAGENPRQLWAARLKIDQSVSVIERRMVFEGPYTSYRVNGGMHPAGDRFAVRVSVENQLGDAEDAEPGPAEQVLVVTNWFDEFRRAIGEGNR